MHREVLGDRDGRILTNVRVKILWASGVSFEKNNSVILWRDLMVSQSSSDHRGEISI